MNLARDEIDALLREQVVGAPQLAHAKDLFVLGDFTRVRYDAHKRVLEAELASLEPPIVADGLDGRLKGRVLISVDQVGPSAY